MGYFIEKIKTNRISSVGIIAIVLSVILSAIFLWNYVNQYLTRSKAYSQEVNLAWNPSSLNIVSGGSGAISLQISTPNTAYKISGLDVTLKGDSKLHSISYQSTTPANYFEAPLIAQMSDQKDSTNPIYRLVLVSKKGDASLASGVIVNFQIMMKTGVSGTSILKIETTPQIVGTPSDRQFNIKTALPLQATINIINAVSPTPNLTPPPTSSFSPTPNLTPPPTSSSSDCHHYYWFDNTNRNCDDKQFCGMYMYEGLRTFDDKSSCLKALEEEQRK